MKIILSLVILLFSFDSYSQYSNYYNVFKSVDLNENLNLSANITTIDYGKLALANTQNERNKLDGLIYKDNKEKEISLEIASNPMKAFDYGTPVSSAEKNISNFKKGTLNYRILHPSLFTHVNKGRFENISIDGIRTQISIFAPVHYENVINIEDSLKFLGDTVGKEAFKNIQDYGITKIFLHKKDLDKATVYGIGGYVGTKIWEEPYQFVISDTYESFSRDNIEYSVRVKYMGNKKETSFEKLEGRRYYLRRVIERMIASASFTDYKFK